MALSAYASPVEKIAHCGVRVMAALVLFFLVAPIFVVFPLSFTPETMLIYPLPGVSLRWYVDLFTNPAWLNAIKITVALAVCVTALATLLGTLAAIGLNRAGSKLRSAVMGLLITPMIVPVIIVAVATFFFYARFGLARTFLGLVLAHTALALPFVVITVTATLQGYDMNLTRAAVTSGASPIRAFWHVTLPLIMPGVVSGMIFAFVTSFDEVVVAIFLGSPQLRTLPRQIWSGVRESISPTIAAASVMTIIASVCLMAIVEILRRRSERIRRGSNT